MWLRIHRGTKEIGGTCIEVEAHGRRLVPDVGLPLDAPDEEGARADLLPAVPGFRSRDDSLLGVVIRIRTRTTTVWQGRFGRTSRSISVRRRTAC